MLKVGHVKIIDHRERFIRECEGIVEERLDKAAAATASRLKVNLSTPGPAPSAPGEPPHAQSKELVNSVFWQKGEKGRDARFERAIGVKDPKGLILDQGSRYTAPRPFLAKTLYEMWQTVLNIMYGRR